VEVDYFLFSSPGKIIFRSPAEYIFIFAMPP